MPGLWTSKKPLAHSPLDNPKSRVAHIPTAPTARRWLAPGENPDAHNPRADIIAEQLWADIIAER